jgi:hypothetical protein
VARLDEWLPEWDVRARYERRVPADPPTALAAALGVPIAPDGLVRTLFRVRGLPRGGSVEGVLRGLGFDVLAREPDCVVFGAAGRPWSPRSQPHAFSRAGPGEVRLAVSLEAEGGVLATETRVRAEDASARRAFARYWLVVGPFSGVIRRRWLAAAERALA